MENNRLRVLAEDHMEDRDVTVENVLQLCYNITKMNDDYEFKLMQF